MKTARLVVLLVNFAILALVAYAGVKLYFSDYFNEKTLTTIDNPAEYLPKEDIKPHTDLSEYDSIAALAQKPVEKIEEETKPPPPTTPTLNVSVKAVVYDPKNPSRSGAHLETGNISRYLTVGDDQFIADHMKYRLKDIKEDKPGSEWTLVFESETGKVAEARYRKQ
jgi:hypothetical protein